MRRVLSLLFPLCLLPAPLQAVDWYVSSQGLDAPGRGSQAQPMRTLNYLLDPANELLQANDRILLRGAPASGPFNECEVRLRLPLTLTSAPGERGHIHCDIGIADSVAVQIDPDASGSRLSGLEISGGALYGVFLQTDWDSRGNPTGRGASNVVIEDCLIHDSGRDAIKLTPKSDDVTIRRCEIHSTGRIYPPGTAQDDKNAEGIDNVNGARMRVEDSYVHDTATSGIYFKGGARDVLVQRNRIERTGDAGILVGFDTSPEFFDLTLNPGYYEALRGIVRNNLIRDTGAAGIGLYASLDSVVANNTLINTATRIHAAIYFGVTLQDFDPAAGRPPNLRPRILNNLIQQQAGDCVAIRWANEIDASGLSGLQGASGMDYNAFQRSVGPCTFNDRRPGSPLPENATLAQWQALLGSDANSLQGSFALNASDRLPAGSALIDRGVVLAEVSDDIDRELRSAPFDIGADERDPRRVFASGFESP